MIPAAAIAMDIEDGIPRESGDDPQAAEEFNPFNLYSPRERG